MLAERKLEILKALVHVSGEITSTLRLDRLLGIIVNSPQNVLPYERCAIALDQRGQAATEGRVGHGNSAAGRHHGGAAESIDALAFVRKPNWCTCAR